MFIKPARSFSRIKKIPYQAPPTRLGPENVHFEKRIFRTQMSMLGFFLEILKNYQAQLFYVLSFPLRYLKTAQKTVQS